MLMRRMFAATAAVLMLAFASSTVQAQFLGTPPRDNFRDTTILRPPAGDKIAIIVFEDMGCPACAHAHPIERQAAEQYHVPLVRYDYPIPAHIWTFDAAVDARYLQDKVSPKLADEYRSAVFASQRMISGKDDLQQFTRQWMQQHGQKMPFVLDPNGALAAKVHADYELGRRLNVEYTPTIVVVSRTNYQVISGTEHGGDPAQLFPVVKAALEQTQSVAAAAHGTHAKAHR